MIIAVEPSSEPTTPEWLAAELYRFYSHGCLVPFRDQGKDIQKLCNDEAALILNKLQSRLTFVNIDQKEFPNNS